MKIGSTISHYHYTSVEKLGEGHMGVGVVHNKERMMRQEFSVQRIARGAKDG